MNQSRKVTVQKYSQIFLEYQPQNSLKICFTIGIQRKFRITIEKLDKVLDSLKKRNLIKSFQSIRNHSNSFRNKDLIYAAINKKSNTPKNQHLTTRKIRQQIKIQTSKKQTQESFFFTYDDISTIKNKTNQSNSITHQSRIDLNILQQFGMKRQNNFIFMNQKAKSSKYQKLQKNEQNTGNKQLINQFSNSQTLNLQNYHRNLHFEKYLQNNSKIQNIKQNFLPNQTILIETKIKNQTPKQTFQKIFIFRQNLRKDKRYYSMPLNQKRKYLQIPLKSQKIKVFQCFKSLKKNTKSSQSLQTKNSTKAFFVNCPNNSIVDQCKYCSIIQKSNQIIKRIKQSHRMF